jgi:flagellar hook protein FlgE
MLRSMFSGVTGLRSHQTMMDVIGNDIANVNTVGFKSSNVVFEDLLSQVLKGASSPANGGAGGTNPAQVGLGVKVGAITTNFNQGASQSTGRATDVSIQGDGFFVAQQGGQQLYTRAGSLSFDTAGRLVTPDGGAIQGWTADRAGNVDLNQPIAEMRMPPGQVSPPAQTHAVTLTGNLPSDAATGDQLTCAIGVYDQEGAFNNVTFQFTKTATANEWSVTALDSTNTAIPGSTKVIDFDPTTGQMTTATPYTFTPPGGTWDTQGITVGFGTPGTPGAMVQFAGNARVAATDQDGSPIGELQSFSIAPDGLVTGVFSNGRSKVLAQLAIANFNNPAGLDKVGGTMFRGTVNSGLPQIGTAGSGGRGLLNSGTVEMSNVDLAQEFTSLIVAQRGFQANSRVITSSDELLQDLVNLKR